MNCEDCGIKHWDKVFDAIIKDKRLSPDSNSKKFFEGQKESWKLLFKSFGMGFILKDVVDYIRQTSDIKKGDSRDEVLHTWMVNGNFLIFILYLVPQEI